MKQLNDCKENTKASNSCSKSEKGKTFLLQSDKKFICDVIDIDGCLFKGEQVRRCDWLFVVPKNNDKNHKVITHPKAYFVELKGINIDEASEQLFNAIIKTRNQISNYDIEARVISTKGLQPEIKNSGFYKKVRKIIKKDIEFCTVHKGNKFTHVETI